MTQPTKSAIREVRDQLFIDSADGEYLTNLTANLNFDRPIAGWGDDDLWRAVVRRAALDYRQIANVFRDLLTLILGPNKTQITTLAEEALLSKEQMTVVDPTNIPQLGTLVIDEALASAQTIAYGYRDPSSGLINLDTSLVATHPETGYNAGDRLAIDHVATATSLQLINSGLFPIAGWSYTIMVGRGTAAEETVELTGHTPGTNTLTIAGPGLANNHQGMQPTTIVAQLVAVSASASVIFVSDSSQLPDEGVIRITQDDGLGTTTEDVVFKSNDLDSNMLTLNRSLTNTYSFTAPDTSVTLLKDAALVELAQVQVKGVEWDVFETEPGVLKLYIPSLHNEVRLQDAWFIHEDDPGTSPTVAVIGAHAVGERSLTTTVGGSLDTFPTAGVALIDSGGANEEHILYHRQDTWVFTKLLPDDPTRGSVPPAPPTVGIPIGSTEIYVETVAPLIEWEYFNGVDKKLTLDRAGTVEILFYTDLDPVTNKITLAGPTTIAHAPEDTVHPGVPDTMYFAHPLANPHAAAETIDLFKPVHAATLLEDGTVFAGDHQFQGSYLSEFFLTAGRDVETTLAENVAGPTSVVMTQKPSRNALEVRDASLINAAFDIRIGRGRGTEEDMDLSAVFLRRDIKGSTVVIDVAGVLAGNTIVPLSDTTVLPTAWGYRLIIARGLANEEVVIVKRIVASAAPGTLEVEDPLTKNHIAGENVELMADVLEFNGSFDYDHFGLIPYDQRLMAIPGPLSWGRNFDPVEELREYIGVVATASFPPAGSVAILNFGQQLIQAESRIQNDTAAASVTLVLESSDAFPVGGYPYLVEVGVDAVEEEHLEVTGNVVGTETLTLQALEFNHKGDPSTAIDSPGGEHVRYKPGEQEEVTFTGATTGPDRLIFDPPIILGDRHLKGEPVRLSGITSSPAGLAQEFPLYLPPNWEDRLRYIFDRCRAAGVQVVVIDNK